ncbi:MAG TPA: cytochrome c family protein [Fimbriimonadaceae bacterium]|nr:cytochrome c family protein [Fimbriimonadaceae bacterium]HRJ32382.1 cytochrome c family protein [Fimbriimonadaceae bacterium]
MVRETEWLVIAGGFDGYLSPCGCVKPMTGGIRRMSDAIQRLRRRGAVTFVQSGGIVLQEGRQDVIKLETASEALRQMGVHAIQLTDRELRLGVGVLASASRLSGDRLLLSSGRAVDDVPIRDTVRSGSFLIGAWSPLSSTSVQVAGGRMPTPVEVARRIVDEATPRSLVPVLLFEGREEEARQVAREVPELGVVVYRSGSNSISGPAPREGSTQIVTGGEKGKALLILPWQRSARAWGRLEAQLLSPEFRDEPGVQRIYASYQRRVAEENLLDRVPRAPSEAFAGTSACMSCHAQAHQVWSESRHARALQTLEKDGSDPDPDCTGCHVVALDRKGGFQSRAKTPDLANVGCESCHGPAAKHAQDPEKNPLPKVGESACTSCHTPNHSPNFDYSTAWPKIVHK